jgi:hypothetical protein
MFIKDNGMFIMRCEICGVNCGTQAVSTICRVMVCNVLAAEICPVCIVKTVEHIQTLLSREAVTFYREEYHIPIDPHHELEPYDVNPSTKEMDI